MKVSWKKTCNGIYLLDFKTNDGVVMRTTRSDLTSIQLIICEHLQLIPTDTWKLEAQFAKEFMFWLYLVFANFSGVDRHIF